MMEYVYINSMSACKNTYKGNTHPVSSVNSLKQIGQEKSMVRSSFTSSVKLTFKKN